MNRWTGDMMDAWIGVDLDGTLAHYEAWNRGVIGPPVARMVEKVLAVWNWPHRVKVFTARAESPAGIKQVEEWLAVNGLPPFEVTNVKDFGMLQLWDDRCLQVIPNTGLFAVEEFRISPTNPRFKGVFTPKP